MAQEGYLTSLPVLSWPPPLPSSLFRPHVCPGPPFSSWHCAKQCSANSKNGSLGFQHLPVSGEGSYITRPSSFTAVGVLLEMCPRGCGNMEEGVANSVCLIMEELKFGEAFTSGSPLETPTLLVWSLGVSNMYVFFSPAAVTVPYANTLYYMV